MITTVTLNASIDKAYYMEKQITNGTVMRVHTCKNSAGGKGLNVARVVKICGEQVEAIGLCGGFNGQYLRNMLREDGIRESFTVTNKETRSCINILDPTYGSTEYLEPGVRVDQTDVDAFLDHYKEVVDRSDVITLSGSVPKGCQADIYKQLITIAKEHHKEVILDSSGETLREGLKALPTMVKPNEDEMEQLLGKRPQNREETIFFAKKIYEMGISNVVVSLGKDGAILVCQDGIFKGTPPTLQVVNPVGCGDSMVGAFAVAMVQNMSPGEAIRYAVSVATSNAMSEKTGDFDRKVFDKIYQETVVTQV